MDNHLIFHHKIATAILYRTLSKILLIDLRIVALFLLKESIGSIYNQNALCS